MFKVDEERGREESKATEIDRVDRRDWQHNWIKRIASDELPMPTGFSNSRLSTIGLISIY